MEFKTVNEVAEALKVHPQTVKRWITKGQLAAFKLGDRSGWRIADDDLRRFLEERRRETTGKATAGASPAAA